MIVKRRIILYIVSFFLLVAVAIIAIFVANGYFFDFKTGKIKRQGMIVLRTVPKNVNVFVDEKFKKNKTPLDISLFPGTYTLKVEKDGFITWQKTANVEAGLVTWFDYVFLVPKDKKIDSVTTAGIKNFLISKDFSKVAFIDLKNNVWTADIATNRQKKLYSPKQETENVDILDLSSDGKNLLIATATKEEKNYKLVSENEEATLNKLPGETTQIAFSLNANDRFYAVSDSNLYLITRGETAKLESGVLTLAQSPGNLYFVKTTGLKNEIWKASFDFKTKDKLGEESLGKVSLYPGENRLVYTVGEDKELFSLESGLKEKINSKVEDAWWSKDDKRLAYRTSKELYIYTFKSDDPRELKNMITTRLSTNIDKAYWFYDSKHLVFREDSKINLIDFDGTYSVTLTDKAAPINSFITTKLGKSLIFAQEENGISNIKVLKLSD